MAILHQLGLEFEVRPADIEERSDGDPVEVTTENARRKALAVDGAVVIGADTVVTLDAGILSKPRDAAQAREWLRALSGRTHRVLGGVCVRDQDVRLDVVETEVRFRRLSERDLDWYLASGEWRERAGAYAIQGRGAALVDAIRGDYLNVVGLSVAALLTLIPDLLDGGR